MSQQQTIAEALDLLESDSKKLLDLCVEMAEAHDGDIYPFDLIANAAANRSLALSAGFRTLVRDKNLICAGALVRLQLDTAFRFYAGFIVDEPHQFALDVFDGQQIRNMTDSTGNKMTDAYLVKLLSEEFTWVKALYHKTCEYIHLSGTHMAHAIDGGVGPNNSFTAKIGQVDRELPDGVYLSAAMAFQQATLIFVRYLNGWVYTKNNPQRVAALKAERDAKSKAT